MDFASETPEQETMSTLDTELDARLSELARNHDVAPFMAAWFSMAEMQFRPLPEEMLEILAQSGDYRDLGPGVSPTWLQIASGDEALELILYRADANGLLYVLAPADRAGSFASS